MAMWSPGAQTTPVTLTREIHSRCPSSAGKARKSARNPVTNPDNPGLTLANEKRPNREHFMAHPTRLAAEEWEKVL